MTDNLPDVVDKTMVGKYPPLVSSGGGYFYDEVLEYRVWQHSTDGSSDTCFSFFTFTEALEFFKSNKGVERPLVLVRQLEWLNEPEPGNFVHRKDERLTEWRVEWLAGRKRQEDSIALFLNGGPEV